MDIRLDGRNALVTGGSLGIGRATARELAASGANVVITARNSERLSEVAKELSRETGVRVIAVTGDMGKGEDVQRVIDDARAALGQIDILINNAGSSPAGRIFELTEDQWRSSYDLKLMGYMRCARAVLPEMQSRKWGRIINVIGRGGDIATPGYLLGAFNAAVLHFTRALALEAARDKVLVNGVSPGAVNTPRWHAIVAQKSKTTGKSEAEIAAQWHATVPVGKAGEPEDVADLITFLCSDRARHIAGSILNIDGGGMAGV
ncbi:MAG: SDR family NAD(P)-dependent oxidoreductase [Burkholderiales bacterium]